MGRETGCYKEVRKEDGGLQFLVKPSGEGVRVAGVLLHSRVPRAAGFEDSIVHPTESLAPRTVPHTWWRLNTYLQNKSSFFF